MTTFAPSVPWLPISAGMTSMPTIKPGHRIVITRNHFDRTRSTSSRFAITLISRNGVLLAALRDGRLGADLLHEDLVQRRHHDLVEAEPDVVVQQNLEQLLRRDAVGEHDLAIGMLARARWLALDHELRIGERSLGAPLR